ncbi:hypothetical protein [Litchfieldia alkalitelluris]|uniref:hypothetical protein n=1 Tax=Litchfieldia alkalitelluris TaxID=304268 RepID=UPI00099772F9|nr:hypothetical protein [Litchfieldia alkalitelluris]
MFINKDGFNESEFLLSHFPREFNKYIEPVYNKLSMIDKISTSQILIGTINEDLANFLSHLKGNTGNLILNLEKYNLSEVEDPYKIRDLIQNATNNKDRASLYLYYIQHFPRFLNKNNLKQNDQFLKNANIVCSDYMSIIDMHVEEEDLIFINYDLGEFSFNQYPYFSKDRIVNIKIGKKYHQSKIKSLVEFCAFIKEKVPEKNCNAVIYFENCMNFNQTIREIFNSDQIFEFTIPEYKISNQLVSIQTTKQRLKRLINYIENEKDANKKGKYLETFVEIFFNQISGLKVISTNLRNDLEEIDIVISNESSEGFFTKMSNLILGECKNWNTKVVGKNELVIFKDKIDSRNGQVNIGFFISWHGYAKTFYEKLYRYSDNRIIIPLTGEDLKKAVESSDYFGVIQEKYYYTSLNKLNS